MPDHAKKKVLNWLNGSECDLYRVLFFITIFISFFTCTCYRYKTFIHYQKNIDLYGVNRLVILIIVTVYEVINPCTSVFIFM